VDNICPLIVGVVDLHAINIAATVICVSCQPSLFLAYTNQRILIPISLDINYLWV